MSDPRGRSRRRDKSDGFSLVEILVATLILFLSMAPIIVSMTTTNRQSHQTADYSTGIGLAAKTAEELRLANWENPHLESQLASTAGALDEAPIVGGESIYYDVIEDTAEPYGRMDPGVDPAIEEGDGPLYVQLGGFKMGVEPEPRSLESTGTVLDLGVTASWTDFQKTRRTWISKVTVGRTGLADDAPPEVVDRERADEAIRDVLYPGETRDLTALAAARGAGIDLLRSLGDVVLLVDSLREGESLSRDERTQLLNFLSGADPRSAAEARISLARVEERRAAILLHSLRYLRPRLDLIDTRWSSEALGSPLPELDAARSSVNEARTMRFDFDRWLLDSEGSYYLAYNPPSGDQLAPRVRTRLYRKIIEIHKLRILTRGPGQVDSLRGLIQALIDAQDGRNQNLVSGR